MTMPLASRSSFSSLHHQQAGLVIPPVERLTTAQSPQLSDSFLDWRSHISGKGARGHGKDAQQPEAFRFAVKNEQRGLLDHGVTPDGKDFIAAAEEAYRASSAYLHELPGGASMPEQATHVDKSTGKRVTTVRITAPFGDTYIPSNRERFSSRGHEGELTRQRDLVDKPFMLDEHSQLNLKKERQLVELLAASMPPQKKAIEVSQVLLESFYSQNLALQPRNGEAVMLLFSHASFLRRLEGLSASKVSDGSSTPCLEANVEPAPSPLTPHDVPFLDEMRRLYAHQKRCFSCPTPLLLEHLMSTLSVITAPSTLVFHLANRLLLDADRYVVLPTRTTYAAFFTVCQINNAMQFAMARYTDAVTALQLPVDAPMLTALLKGLNESGYVEEAVSLLSRVQHVAVSTPLLNASLETLLLSDQALACFSLYEAMQNSSAKPNAETYTLLLLACEKSQQWGHVTAVLADMQRRRVRGNEQTLNLLLKGLLQERLHSFAAQLHHTMVAKGVPVWPALSSGVKLLHR